MFNRNYMASRIAKKASILEQFDDSVHDVLAHFEYKIQSALSDARKDIKVLMSELKDPMQSAILNNYADYLKDLKEEIDLKSAEIHRKLGK